MHPEMVYCYRDPLIAYSLLENFDIESFENALDLIFDGQSKPLPELIQLKHALKSYFKECNHAFLASESIRFFLLIGILASLLISLIALASMPVSILTISLICFESLILLSVDFFTLYKQMSGYEQKSAKDNLKKCNLAYQKKLNSRLFTLNPNNIRDQNASPTSTSCLFSSRTILQNELTGSTDENCSSAINENSCKSLTESNDSSHLFANTL